MRNPIFKATSSLLVVAQAEQVLAAEVASIVGTATVPVNGVAMTATQLAALFAGHVEEIHALIRSKAELHDQVLHQRVSRRTSRTAAQRLKAWVTGVCGAASPQATTLGFQPPNRHPATVATKAEAQEKSKVTRAQRHPVKAPATRPA
jgi:hypothetical protein